MWEIAFAGPPVMVRDSKGMMYIYQLLSCPQKEWHCAELLFAGTDKADVPILHSGGASRDKRTVRQCLSRRTELLTEIAEAEVNREGLRARHYQQELNEITSYLHDRGIRRTDREFDDQQKIRKSVTNAMTRAINAIKAHNAPAADHLLQHVRLGVYVVYEAEHTEWEF